MEEQETRTYKEALRYIGSAERVYVWICDASAGGYLAITKLQAEKALASMRRIENTDELACIVTLTDLLDVFIH
jgi:hypothetical protein